MALNSVVMPDCSIIAIGTHYSRGCLSGDVKSLKLETGRVVGVVESGFQRFTVVIDPSSGVTCEGVPVEIEPPGGGDAT